MTTMSGVTERRMCGAVRGFDVAPCGGVVEGSPSMQERGGNFRTNRGAQNQMVQEAGA